MFVSLLALTISQIAASGGHGEEDEKFTELKASEGGTCSQIPLGNYNFGLHLAAVFIVLTVSTIGIFTTIYLGRSKQSPLTTKVLQALKMFGIGVIAATAWIHLLHDAINNFSSPCLGSGWAEYGIHYVGLFALIAAFGIQVIEQVAISKTEERRAAIADSLPFKTDDEALESERNSDVVVLKDSSHSHEMQVFLMSQSINTVILEIGILIHSLIIGINLGITEDEFLVTLLVAVAFHQMFEGMALGALIGSTTLQWKTKWILGIAYPLTTPIGIAIGIIVRNSFNTNSSTLILIQGILASLSLGILMYNTYVELIGREVNRNPVFKAYSSEFKMFCYFMMFLGAASLAVLGIWA
jgi:ZIP zinc/iron transport family